MPITAPLRRALATASLVVLSIAVLAGCASAEEPTPTETPATEYAFDPNGGAGGNLDFFRQTLQRAGGFDTISSASLRSSVESAGFAVGTIETTPDTTTLIDYRADFVQVSVLMPQDGQCLIGQVNAAGASAIVAAPMSTGSCMIGDPNHLLDPNGVPKQ